MKLDEIRMRCIEALSTTGVREASRLVKDADILAEWVNEATENVKTPEVEGAKDSG